MTFRTQSARRRLAHSGRRAWAGPLTALLVTTVAIGAAWAGKVSYTGAPQKSADCDRCNVQAEFANKVRACGAQMEFIELKNGTGVVYTVSDPHMVSKLQKSVAWVRDELTHFSADPDHYKLCTYCKASHPIYSKIEREVALTDDGAIFLMRSQDPDAQRVLHEIFVRSKMEQSEQAMRPAPSR
jgi:hypothetical protein